MARPIEYAYLGYEEIMKQQKYLTAEEYNIILDMLRCSGFIICNCHVKPVDGVSYEDIEEKYTEYLANLKKIRKLRGLDS